MGSPDTLSREPCKHGSAHTALPFLCPCNGLSIRELSLVQQVVKRTTEDKRFSPSSDHHPLPEGLSRFHIFEFPYMMDLKRASCCFAVLTLAAIHSANKFRAAERQCQRVRRNANVRTVYCRASEVFEPEESENAHPVLVSFVILFTNPLVICSLAVLEASRFVQCSRSLRSFRAELYVRPRSPDAAVRAYARDRRSRVHSGKRRKFWQSLCDLPWTRAGGRQLYLVGLGTVAPAGG